MSTRNWIWLLLAPALIRTHAGNLDGLNEAVGVNQTLEEGFGARQSGMGIGFASFQRDADAVANSPASMNDVDDFTFSTSHTEKFGAAKFDDFALLIPFESRSTLGLGISRYGISGVENWREDSDPLAAQPAGIFSVADYLLVGAFARRWGGFDLGLNLNVIYRHLDQEGIGMRGDGMAQYTWDKRFRVSALMKGLIPSSASWESGYSEYEAPEIYLGGAARFPAPYFYGTLEAAWQSEGLFHRTARSSLDLNANRAWDKPQQFLAASNLGLEFLFDFGMAVRFGVSEFSRKSFTDVTTFGLGYNWRHVVGLDYSFTPSPNAALLATHRISLQFTPAFPKFTGRDFRYRSGPRPVPGSGAPSGSGPDVGNPPVDDSEGEILEPQGAHEEKPAAPAPQTAPVSQPLSPPAPAANPPAASQTAPAKPAAPTPAPAAPKAPAKPAAAQPVQGGEEIIDNEDEGQ
jgi:hypothetical protein